MKPFKRLFVMLNENFKHKSSIFKEGANELKDFISEMENFSLRKIDNISDKIQRKIKTLPVYFIAKVNGSIKKIGKRVSLDNAKRLFNISKPNKIVGFTPDYFGVNPSKPVSFNNIFINYFSDNLKEVLNKYPQFYNPLIKTLTNFREVYSGSYDSNGLHLRSFLGENSTTIDAKTIIDKMRGCKWLPSLKYNYDNFIEAKHYLNYNPKSNPGHYTSKLFNYKNKGATIPLAVPLAEHKYKMIREIPLRNFTLWTINSREKDFKVDNLKEGEIVTTRLVCNTEHYEIYLLSYFFQCLMKGVDSFYNKKVWNIVGELDGKKFNKISKTAENYDYYLDADWSMFDSTIDTQYLLAAGCIMFSNSNLDKPTLRMFYHVISSFITKYLVLPPGIVVELNRGNPSGHPGVTAINCYVNAMRWAMIGLEIYGDNYQENMAIEVYGDDALVFFKHNDKLVDLDKIISKLGYKSDPLYEKLTSTNLFGLQYDDGPDFLKRRLYHGGVIWSYTKMFDRLIYQTKKRTLKEQIDVLVNYYITAPTDDALRDLIYDILNYIKEIHHDNDEIVIHVKNSIELISSINKDRYYLNNIQKSVVEVEDRILSVNTAIPKYIIEATKRKKIKDVEQFDIIKALYYINEYNNGVVKTIWSRNITRRETMFKLFTRFNPRDIQFLTKPVFNTS